MADRYEEIRRKFFSQQQGMMKWGFAVLKTKGMMAWARSWQEFGKDVAKPKLSEPSALAVSPHLPPNSEEVVQVLAGMIWAIQEETIP